MKNGFIRLLQLVFLSAAAMTALSCDGESGGGDLVEPSLPDAAFVLDAGAGSSAAATCTFADAWQAEPGSDAYEIAPASGAAGTFELVVRAKEANEAIREREESFTIQTGGSEKRLHIIQRGMPGIVPVSPTYTIAPDARSLEILLDANVAFSAESDADWVEVAEVKHSDPVLLQDGKTYSDSLRSSLTLRIGENREPRERTARLSLSGSAEPCLIEIRQSAPLTVEWDREFFRRTAIVRFTATWCHNCPLMATAIATVQQTLPERIIPISMHAINSEGGLAFYQVGRYEKLYDVGGYPTGVANNMAKIENERPVEALEAVIEAAVEEASADYPARTGISAHSQIVDNRLRVDVSVAVRQQDEYSICAFLLENSIVYSQSGITEDYVHDNVVRAVLTDELFGDPLPAAESREIVKYSIDSELPRSVVNPENLCVVIAVARPAAPEVQGVEKVIYLDLGTIWDNAVVLPANGFAALRYEE